MQYAKLIFINILFVTLTGTLAFWAGKYSSNTNNITAIQQNNVTKYTFNGKIYQISYPWNWIFEGPTEGPITGFPEFSKLISPSGDTQIIIGLRGDNRFEYVYNDIRQETKETEILIGNKTYKAEESFYDINEDPEFNISVVETEIQDFHFIGYTQGAKEIKLPMKIQLLYRFSSENISFDEKLKVYEAEKNAALEILKTFKLNSNVL